MIPMDIAQNSQVAGGREGRTMWDLVRRVEGMDGSVGEESERPRTKESVGFAGFVAAARDQ